MNIADVKQTLCGPMIPIITNLKDDLTINHDAIRENVRYVIERGVVKGDGVLLAAGAGGDFPMLTVQERKDVARTIVEAADGQTPVLVGVQDTNSNVMIEMARWAAVRQDVGLMTHGTKATALPSLPVHSTFAFVLAMRAMSPQNVLHEALPR